MHDDFIANHAEKSSAYFFLLRNHPKSAPTTASGARLGREKDAQDNSSAFILL
jgi:hypothetical protein